MKQLFLVLAIAGAILPYAFFIDFFLDQGFYIDAFVMALFANGAAGGFTVDLLISSLVFWIFLVHEKADRLWLYVLINLTIGLSCALPLYFYLRTRSAQ